MRWAAPPFPPEHGSWALMASGIVIGVGAAPSPRPTVVLGLVVAAFAANMLRGAILAAMRRRVHPGATAWIPVWGSLAGAAITVVVVELGDSRLLWLVPVTALIVLVHVGMSRIKAARRLDRTFMGELMGASGIALFAPAAYLASGGQVSLAAGMVWLAAAAQSASGILHVRAIIGSLRLRKAVTPALAAPAVYASAAYHLLLMLALAFTWAVVERATAASLSVAYAPLILRSVSGWRPRTVAPRFTRVGIAETVLSLWCAGWTAAALRVAF